MDPHTVLANRSARSHGVFTTADARAAGLSIARLKYGAASGRYVAVYKGIYVHASAPRTLEMYQVAACRWAGDRAALSHRSALMEYGLADVVAETIEVTTVGRRCPNPQVLIHRTNYLPRAHVVHRRGRPFTDVARTLFDCGYVVRLRTVSLAIDQAVQRNLTTTKILWGRLVEHGGPGRRGCGTLRKVLSERDPLLDKTESTFESLMVRVVWAGGLPRPVPQFVVRCAGRTRRLDFAYPQIKLGIEADGRSSHGSLEAFEDDRRRDTELAAEGWLVLRFTWRQVRQEPDWVIERIKSVHAQRSAESLVVGGA